MKFFFLFFLIFVKINQMKLCFSVETIFFFFGMSLHLNSAQDTHVLLTPVQQ